MGPVMLTILDGFGLRDEVKGNAVKLANKPNFDMLWEKYPHSKLDASGISVGLPEGQMGNSEVGHLNIGSGRVVYQALELINNSIRDGSFFQNSELLNAINHAKNNNSKLHIMGLISDGGVHSHIDHLMAILDMCRINNVDKVFLHLFTDGRDVDPYSSYQYIEKVENKLKEIGIGSIASISGRYYAMDRDNNYDRLEKAYDVIVNGIGPRTSSVKEFIDNSYNDNITDEFLVPTLFSEDGRFDDNDAVITFNFRKDRLRELLTAITNPSFDKFEVIRFNNLKVVTMLPVVASVIADYAFDDLSLDNVLGQYIASCGMNQLRIAETEKYAHVTYFFDGGKEVNFPGEKKILIPSPKVATYDLKPEMSIYDVTDTLINELSINNYDLVVLNFANCDMVGHTGNLEASIKAVEAVDKCLGMIYEKVDELNGLLIVTADHGNCEFMLDEDDNVITSHTTNKVPFVVCSNNYILKDGKLSDIAPTILEIMNLEIPKEMSGKVLIEETI